MGARDDDDIRKYMPDLKTIARTADPALAEERYREAINNPELDRALDDLRQGNEPGRAPFEFPVVVALPKQAETPAPGPAAPVVPGPAAPVVPVVPVAPVAAAKVAGWQTGAGPARGGAARVDVATPERPAATPPGPARAPSRDAAPPPRDWRRGMSRRRIAVLLAAAVLGPLATHQIFSRFTRSEAPVASAAPVAPSEAVTASGRPSAEAPAVAAGASAGAPAVNAGANDDAPPPKAGASAEEPPPKAAASGEVPPPKAAASARPAVPAPRAPAGPRPPPAEVSPAPPEIAADIMH
ncbi:hypothetical protein [Sorangium sp. So ce1000]|uniref:hypothetical protein n=1 Tax=Sorangium sp. So ce1000 TaxID=3133325 RepID=UPI003F5E53CA